MAMAFVMVMLAMEVLSSAPLAAEPRASEFPEIRLSRAVGMPSSASSHPRAVELPPVDGSVRCVRNDHSRKEHAVTEKIDFAHNI